jgi:hypothetical protein
MRIATEWNSSSQGLFAVGTRVQTVRMASWVVAGRGRVVCSLFGSLAIFLAGVESSGQVVQLPTFRQFTVSTSVSVPDGGTASLAGNGYLAESYVGSGMPLFGPLGASRARTRTSYSQHATVSVSVTNFREEDARVLAAAAREELENKGRIKSGGASGRTTGELPMVLRPAGSSASGGISGPGGLAAANPGHFSVAELKQQRQEAQVRSSKSRCVLPTRLVGRVTREDGGGSVLLPDRFPAGGRQAQRTDCRSYVRSPYAPARAPRRHPRICPPSAAAQPPTDAYFRGQISWATVQEG